MMRLGQFTLDPAGGELCRRGHPVPLSAGASRVIGTVGRKAPHSFTAADVARKASLTTEQVRLAARELESVLGGHFRFDEENDTLSLRADDSLYGFLEELRQRKVFRVATGYAVTGWLLLQVAEIVFPLIGLDGSAMRILLISIIVGFPVAVTLAWALELTPSGLVFDWRRTRPGRALVMDERKLDRFIIAALVLVIAVLIFRVWTQDFAGPAASQVVAILPFESAGADGSGSNLCDGFAEEIRVGLDRLPGIQVASRELSASLSQSGGDTAVSWLVTGTCQLAENNLKVQVVLSENETGLQRWAYSDARSLDEILTFQDDVAATLALKLAVPASALQATADAETANPRAYRFYLQGLGYLSRPNQAGYVATAAELFTNAIREDEEYAAAHAGLCEARLMQYLRSHEIDTERQAESACLRASQLGPGLPEVHVALGKLFLETGDYGAAGRALKTALELKPGSVKATRQLANVLAAERKWAQAETLYREALAVPSGSWEANSDYGRFLLRRGRLEEAAAQFEEVVTLTPDNAPEFNNLGATYLQLGLLDKASENFRRVAEIEPEASAISNYGTMLYYTGRFEEAEAQFRRAAQMSPSDHRLRGNVADALYQLQGRREEAIEAYREASRLANTRLQVSRKDAQALGAQGFYNARAGDPDAGAALVEEALVLAPEDPELHYFAALVDLAAGDAQAALQRLARAAALGYPRFLLEASPDLKTLADRADFAALFEADGG